MQPRRQEPELESAAERALERLTAAVGRGELGLDEFDRRSGVVASATSTGEVRAALAGLDPVQAAPALVGPALVSSSGRAIAARRRGPSPERRAWAVVAAVNLAVWLLLALTVGPVYFWPFWVIVPWGLVLLSRRIAASSRPSIAAPRL